MVEITVRRPNGQTEMVEKPLNGMTPALWAQIIIQTRQAGRGECLSYRIVAAPVVALTPAETERRRIWGLLAAADRRADYPEECIRLRMQADKALAAWREQYPVEAEQEKKKNLIGEAAHLESAAKDALVYDADGWLSAADQQARHDDYLAQAANLRAQAENL